MAVRRVFGRPVAALPDAAARTLGLTFIVTGISLGGAVTPEMLAGIATWPLSILALTLAMIVLTASGRALSATCAWLGPGSAFLGACPGALATVIMWP